MAPAVVHRTGRPVLSTHFSALLIPLAGAFKAPTPAPTPAPTAAPVTPPTVFPTGPAATAIAEVLINPATRHDNKVNSLIIYTPNN